MRHNTTRANSKLIGKAKEEQAANFLKTKGLKILQHNFYAYGGEIDIVCQDINTLVFVEVKFRKNANHGSAAETVTYSKQTKIIRTAEFYLLKHNIDSNTNCRFDVIAINNNTHSSIEWIKDAFQC